MCSTFRPVGRRCSGKPSGPHPPGVGRRVPPGPIQANRLDIGCRSCGSCHWACVQGCGMETPDLPERRSRSVRFAGLGGHGRGLRLELVRGVRLTTLSRSVSKSKTGDGSITLLSTSFMSSGTYTPCIVRYKAMVVCTWLRILVLLNIGQRGDRADEEDSLATMSFADEQRKPVPASHYGLPGKWPKEVLVTATFADIKGGKTKLTVRETGVPRQVAGLSRLGWEQRLDKFADALVLMSGRTRIIAEPGKQEIIMKRIYDAPGRSCSRHIPIRRSYRSGGGRGCTRPSSTSWMQGPEVCGVS